jgi:hemolysin activation/secretion protein
MKYSTPFQLASTVILLNLLALQPLTFANHESPVQTNPALQTPSSSLEKLDHHDKVASPKTPETTLSVPAVSPDIQIKESDFMAKKIVVDGINLIPQASVKAIVEPYEGKTVTLGDLQKMVEAITLLYRNKGYLTTQVYIPPQEITSGDVKISVVEGLLGKVCVTPGRHYRATAIKRYVGIKPGTPFDIKQLEKNLNATNQANNVSIKAILSPGAKTGQTDVTIETADKGVWQVSPTFDNQGRPFIGTFRGGAEISNNSLLGYGDQLLIKYLAATRTQVGMLSYNLPINSRGDALSFNYSNSYVNVDTHTATQSLLEGYAQNFGLSYSHPFDKNRHWVGDIGIISRHVTTDVENRRDTTSEIRSLVAGLNYASTDKYGRTFIRGQAMTGLDILGGTAKFFKTELFANRLIKLPMNNILYLRGYGQYSPDVLPSAEVFQLGGAYSVRGFTEGLLTGDRGYSLTVEDRFPIPFLKKISPKLSERVQGAVFVDFGQAFIKRANSRFIANVSNRNTNTLLVSAGVGLRARFSQYLQGFIDLGFPLVDRNSQELFAQPTARIHFGVRSDLLNNTAFTQSKKKAVCELPPEQPEHLSFLQESQFKVVMDPTAPLANPLETIELKSEETLAKLY